MAMTTEEFKALKPGDRLTYDDGRGPHTATVDGWFAGGLKIQFDDRASSTTIFPSEREWLDHLSVAVPAATNPGA